MKQQSQFQFQFFTSFSLFTPILTNYVNYNNDKKRKKNKGKVATCALGITLK